MRRFWQPNPALVTAVLLLLITPLLHLHYRDAVPEEGALSAQPTVSSCSICRLQKQHAITVDSDHLHAGETGALALFPSDTFPRSLSVISAASRAPPRTDV